MEREIARYSHLLQQRLKTLRLLAAEIQQSRAACVELDLESIHWHCAHQEYMCHELRSLDSELRRLQSTFGGDCGWDQACEQLSEWLGKLDPTAAQPLRTLLKEVAAAQAEVRRLNRVHAELLRRSRRSLHVLMNFMANYSATYQPPKPAGMPLRAAE